MLKLIITLLIVTNAAHAKTLRVGFFNLFPHAIEKDGKPTGAKLDYFKLIASEMKVDKVEYFGFPLTRLIQKLKSDELDLILYLGKNTERAKLFTYPESAFFKMQSAIIVQKSNLLKVIKNINDIKNLTIGIWAKGYLSPLLHDNKFQLVKRFGDNVVKTSLKMILSNRLDAFYSPEMYSLKFEAIKLNKEKSLKILNLPESTVGLYSVFSKTSAMTYLAKYEKALKLVESKQNYEEFLGGYFSKK